jgi:hypothetical protein
MTVAELARLFRVERKAMSRMLKANTIRHKKLNRQANRVVDADLPADKQSGQMPTS